MISVNIAVPDIEGFDCKILAQNLGKAFSKTICRWAIEQQADGTCTLAVTCEPEMLATIQPRLEKALAKSMAQFLRWKARHPLRFG